MNSTNARSIATNGPDGGNHLDKLLEAMPCTVRLNKEEIQMILAETILKTYKKGSLLLREGQIATACYAVFKGCVREYYLIGDEERTTEFYMAGDSMSDEISKLQRIPTKKYWECIEDTTVSVFTYEQERKMYDRFPRLESICRIETEKKFGIYRDAMAFFLAATPEERYLNLLKTRPYLLDKVPQYQLASYLGVKPESLSRIRGRILLNKDRVSERVSR